jgi:hypothetical protein
MERQRIAAMRINPALQIAEAIQKADPNRLAAIREGVASVYGNKTGQTDAALLGKYEAAIKVVTDEFKDDPRSLMKDKRAAWEKDKASALERINKDYAKYGIGPLASGGLPSAVPSATPSAPPAAGGYTVTAGGLVHSFPTLAAADAFRKASGAK